jgi:lipopolysaccharide exporter
MTSASQRTSEPAWNMQPESIDNPDSQSLSDRVRRGVLWSIASAAMLKLVGVLTTAVVARILNPRDFGVFAVASTVYIIVFSVGELGVASCLGRGDLDIDANAPTMVLVSWTTSVVQAAAMVVFARPIATALGSEAAAGPIRVMALVVILVGIFSVPSSQLMREFKQDKIFKAEAFAFAVSTVVLLVLARSGSGAMAFAWSRVVGQFVSGCFVVASVPKNYGPGISRAALSLLLRFGLPLGGASFVSCILLNVDYALIGHLLGAVALGTYVLAFNVSSLPGSLFGFMIQNVSLPAFSRVKHDPELLNTTISGALRAVALLVMPISAVTMALARPLVLTVYGAKWAASSEVLSILAFYGALTIICTLVANILAGLGRAGLLLIVQLIWITTLFPAMVIGVHRDGIVGAAVAHVVIIGPIVLPVYLVALMRTTGVRCSSLIKAMLPAVLAASAAALAAKAVASQFAVPWIGLIVGGAAAGLIYVLAAAPLLIDLVNRGRIAKLPIESILRPYSFAARLLGLGYRPKHSGTGSERHERVTSQSADLTGEPVATEAPIIRGRAALELLMSLARPEPAAWPATARTVDRVSDTLQQYRVLG